MADREVWASGPRWSGLASGLAPGLSYDGRADGLMNQIQPRETVISLQQLRRVFKSRKSTVEAVAGIDLEVYAGEIFGFLGPNGAGKTTTLRMLAPPLPPRGGGKGGRQRSAAPAWRGAEVDRLCRPEWRSRSRGHRSHRAHLRRTPLRNERRGGRPARSGVDRDSGVAGVRRPKGLGLTPAGQRRRLDIGVGLVHRPRPLPRRAYHRPDPQSRARMWDEVRNLRERRLSHHSLSRGGGRSL